MIQAFVSLKLQQPPRTESGMRSFFEALQGAVFSQPTIFRTNADASVRPYSLEAIVEATLNPRCKFVVIRAEKEKFWQCTFLLPDKQGMGALFFDLQRAASPRRLSPESLIEMFKKLYKSLSPRLIRIGDSEAREKLKSKHGLVQMPGIGRTEWLQIVSPELFSDIYNPSELVAAPCYSADILEDGALFLRIYEDPNDWDSEDNISQANFIPGFLAGIAKIKDSDKVKENLRDLERIWSRAEKTAENAYEALDGAAPSEPAKAAEPPKAAEPAKPAEPEQAAEKKEEPEANAPEKLEDDDLRMRSVIYNRLKSDFKVDENNITKASVEGPCTIFKVKPDNKPVFYASYQDLDWRVFVLNSLEDLARFISTNGCTVNQKHIEKIRTLLKNYYHPEYHILNTIDMLPLEVRRDRRVKELEAEFKPASVESNDGVNNVTFWFYRPDITGVETLTMTQFEEMPMQLEVKIRCTDMENEPEPPTTLASEVTAERKAPKAETLKEPVKAEEKKEAPKADELPAKAEADEVPAEQGSSDSIALKVVFIIIVLLIVAYIAAAFLMYDGDFMFIEKLINQ